MQDFDFSGKWKKGEEKTPPKRATAQESVKEERFKSKNLIPVLAGGILIFTAGLYAGIQVHRIQGVKKVAEEQVSVKRPQENKSEKKRPPAKEAASLPDQVSFAERSPAQKGSYIVKIGSFPEKEAEKITTQINSIPEMAATMHEPCKGVKEGGSDRYAGFRTKVNGESNMNNVLLGCFSNREDAERAWRAVYDSSIRGTENAKIFHIR